MIGSKVILLGLFVCSMVSLNLAVPYDEINWTSIDPYWAADYHLKALTDKNLCDPDKKLCEVEAKAAIMQYFNGEEVRARCEDSPEHNNLCWIRRKKYFAGVASKKTVWEMQIWLNMENKTEARYAAYKYKYTW